VSEAPTFRDLDELAPLIDRLMEAGLSKPPAEDKATLFAACAGALSEIGVPREAEVRCFYVPGRIEVLGKHTDYAGGRSILAATERGFCVVASPREDNAVHMIAAVSGQGEDFAIDPDLKVKTTGWANYPMTVARRLARNFPGPLRGANLAFASDLPQASGMSSSSALLVASYLVLADVNKLSARDEYRRNIKDSEALAGYLGTVENGQSFGTLVGDKGVGTFGGSEDHTAILCCRAGKLSQYSYCPVRPERVIDMPRGYVFAVGCSGVVAEKTGDAREKYNRASARARLAAEAWNQAAGRNDPHLAAAVRSSPHAAARIRAILNSSRVDSATPEELAGRFEQFHAENEEILPAAGEALAEKNLAIFGECVDRSQKLAEELLGNQVPETVFLARSARQIGAVAASAFGAGFGGSVWALVKASDAEGMLAEWARRYAEAFPVPAGNATFFMTHAGPAAFRVCAGAGRKGPAGT